MFRALFKAANLPQCFSYSLDHKIQSQLAQKKSPQCIEVTQTRKAGAEAPDVGFLLSRGARWFLSFPSPAEPWSGLAGE